MNEYARLARAKEPSARTTAELIAAAYGADQETADRWAALVDGLTIDQLPMKLPQRAASVRHMWELFTELTTRRANNETVRDGLPTFRTMADVSGHAIDIRDKKKEYLLAFFVNARHQLIHKEIISIGTLTASLAHPREIFSPAIGKAAAEAMRRALHKLPQFRGEASFTSWVHAIAWSATINRRPATIPLDALPVEPAEPPSHGPAFDELAALRAALDALPGELRSLVVGHYLEGHSIAALARQRRIPQGTVLSRLFRGRDQLRDRYRRIAHAV